MSGFGVKLIPTTVIPQGIRQDRSGVHGRRGKWAGCGAAVWPHPPPDLAGIPWDSVGKDCLSCRRACPLLHFAESDGGFVAEALGESVITQADTWDELRANVREAVTAFYFDQPMPARVRLHLVRDEVIA